VTLVFAWGFIGYVVGIFVLMVVGDNSSGNHPIEKTYHIALYVVPILAAIVANCALAYAFREEARKRSTPEAQK
jgi:multisubunit Na+/H+ antiporter MnhE subunit